MRVGVHSPNPCHCSEWSYVVYWNGDIDATFWLAVGGTPSSAARAGHLGLPMMLAFVGGTNDHIRHLIEVYRAAGERAGHAPETLKVE